MTNAMPSGKTKDGFDALEWKSRCELAAAYRLMAHFKMTDLTSTHLSLRVEGSNNHYLLNPYGLLFEEVTASNLVKFDLDGNVLDDTSYIPNPAGYAFHASIHKARLDAAAIVHSHSRAGCAFAALDCELEPINQISMIFHGHVAYAGYSFVSEVEEATSAVEALGDKKVMIMRNHGLLTCGRTIGEAFILAYYLDKACEIQLDAMASGRSFALPSKGAVDHAVKGWWDWDKDQPFGVNDWNALLRTLDSRDSSYRT
ncbi:MAG: class II aldolase/adducin family protein [Pseudomonadota bacterium]